MPVFQFCRCLLSCPGLMRMPCGSAKPPHVHLLRPRPVTGGVRQSRGEEETAHIPTLPVGLCASRARGVQGATSTAGQTSRRMVVTALLQTCQVKCGLPSPLLCRGHCIWKGRRQCSLVGSPEGWRSRGAAGEGAPWAGALLLQNQTTRNLGGSQVGTAGLEGRSGVPVSCDGDT